MRRQIMPRKPESKDEMIKRLTKRFEKVLREKLPDEPGTLEEIEKITEEIGADIKRDIQDGSSRLHGTGYCGVEIACGCGGIAKFKNYYDKRHVTLCSELVIRRAYYYCEKCGTGFSPVDEKLGLDSLCTSIGVRTRVARLAIWIPFDRLSKELKSLCGLHLSKNTLERLTESVGDCVKQEKRQRESLVLSGKADIPGIAPDRLYIGIDGTGVPMRGGGTRESKCGIIYETRERPGKTEVVRAEYLATIERVESFGEAVYARAFDRGVERACDVACLGDGAAWIWRSFSAHYPRGVQILDYYHASEHLGIVARAWFGEGTDKAKRWVKDRQRDLLSDCVETVIRSIRSWRPVDYESREVRRLGLKYFLDNKNRMLYASLAANGYHIGSGLVESTCKTVVGMRLKQSGMRWSESGAESMLHLRALLLSNPNADLSRYARPYLN
jgi:Uncharacterised protein family (UPF0236)